MEKTRNQIIKKAAESIRTLVSQIDEFEKVGEKNKLAKDIVSKLANANRLSKDEILPKLEKLENESMENLKIVSKAIELGTFNDNIKLGEVSDQTELDGLTPKERFLKNVLGI